MNKWKISFFVLLAIVILAIASIILAIRPFASPAIELTPNEVTEKDASFHVKGEAKDFIAMGNKTLREQYEEKKIELPIALQLDRGKIRTMLELPVFSATVSTELYFDAEALENGDVLLHLSEVHAGNLSLPPQTVLQFLSRSSALPKGVKVRPKESELHVDMQEMTKNNAFRIAFTTIDLPKDEVSFDLIIDEEE